MSGQSQVEACSWLVLRFFFGYICTRLVPTTARTRFGNINCEIPKKMDPYCNSTNDSKHRKFLFVGTNLRPKFIY